MLNKETRGPFRYPLVPSGYRNAKGETRRIKFLQGYPDVVIREYWFDNYVGRGYLDLHLEDYKKNREILLKLRNCYGINVPDFDIVIGPSDHVFSYSTRLTSLYIVTERVAGENLDKKKFLPEERETVYPQLESLYLALISYHQDVYRTGGWFIHDLTYGGPGVSGHVQYVYGKTHHDLEDKVYLVDLGPNIVLFNNSYDSSSSSFFNRNVYRLWSMIEEMEERLGVRFQKPREQYVRFLNTVPESEYKGNAAMAKRQIETS